MSNTKKIIMILSAVILSALVFGAAATVIIQTKNTNPAETLPETTEIDTVSDEITTYQPVSHTTEDSQPSSANTSAAVFGYDEAVKILLGGFGLDGYTRSVMSEEFIAYIADKCGKSKVISVAEALKNEQYTVNTWYTLAYQSIYALYADFTQDPDCVFISGSSPDSITLGFVGDISFADNWDVMSYYGRRAEGLDGIISAEVVSLLRSFDIAAANNEFSVSTRGEPISKAYAFRAKPENLILYKQMGIDFVSTANNHIYDYGKTALLDTLSALDEYNIAHAGAGENSAEASKPLYYVINGRKIAILCGSRAEKNRITPVADENTAGVFGMYDSAAMIQAVASAHANADFVIVFAHWGKEDSPVIEEVIRTQAEEYIDAGADLIVGAHAHQLQGVEFYKNKLIAYNLGNFLFEEGDLMTGILKINLSGDLSYSAEFIPCRQKDCKTVLCAKDDRLSVTEYLQSLSVNAGIGQNGEIRQKSIE